MKPPRQAQLQNGRGSHTQRAVQERTCKQQIWRQQSCDRYVGLLLSINSVELYLIPQCTVHTFKLCWSCSSCRLQPGRQGHQIPHCYLPLLHQVSSCFKFARALACGCCSVGGQMHIWKVGMCYITYILCYIRIYLLFTKFIHCIN